MNLVLLAARLVALKQFFFDVGHASRRQQGRRPIEVGNDVVGDRARLDVAWPAHHGRYAVGAFPVGVLLASERRHAGVGPGVHVRTVVGTVHDDGVVGDAQLVDLVEHGADILVVVDHRVMVRALPASGLAQALGFGVGAEVHVGEVDPDEHRFPGLGLFFDEFGGTGGGIIIDSLHALFG